MGLGGLTAQAVPAPSSSLPAGAPNGNATTAPASVLTPGERRFLIWAGFFMGIAGLVLSLRQ